MAETTAEYTVEVCLTPRLFDGILTEGECVIVLADILRATTSICYAFSNGVASVIPILTRPETWDHGVVPRWRRPGEVIG